MITPNTPKIYNVTVTSSNTWYSQVLPDNTRKIRVWMMDSNKQYPHGDGFHIAYEDNADNVIAIQPAGAYEEDEVNLEGKTIFIQSPTGGGIAIIRVFT